MKELVENKIYAAVIGHCEDMEARDVYKGNGHHLAQKITALVSIGILSKHKAKIYSALTDEYLPTRDIANKVEMTTKNVSAQLMQMSNTTLLIASKTEGRLKKWKRNLN